MFNQVQRYSFSSWMSACRKEYIQTIGPLCITLVRFKLLMFTSVFSLKDTYLNYQWIKRVEISKKIKLFWNRHEIVIFQLKHNPGTGPILMVTLPSSFTLNSLKLNCYQGLKEKKLFFEKWIKNEPHIFMNVFIT